MWVRRAHRRHPTPPGRRVSPNLLGAIDCGSRVGVLGARGQKDAPEGTRDPLDPTRLPPSPSYNEREYRTVAEQVWTFTRTLDVPAAALDEASVDLVLDGVDTVADVAVNGRIVARLENAHR
jgi:hypothetical protein